MKQREYPCSSENYFLHPTANSPPWMADVHKITPAINPVSTAELPISEKAGKPKYYQKYYQVM